VRHGSQAKKAAPNSPDKWADDESRNAGKSGGSQDKETKAQRRSGPGSRSGPGHAIADPTAVGNLQATPALVSRCCFLPLRPTDERREKFKTALDETRLLMLGSQIFFGFQFNGIFQTASTLCRSGRGGSMLPR